MSYERITKDQAFDGFPRERHEIRYAIAGVFTTVDDVVLDCACGTGYGRDLMRWEKYHGVDKEKFKGMITADLNTWEPDFEFDVFVSIETIEHLENYRHLLEVGRRAKRVMIISTPIVPTKADNEFHVHDFTREEVEAELKKDGWKIYQYLIQDNQYGIWILKK